MMIIWTMQEPSVALWNQSLSCRLEARDIDKPMAVFRSDVGISVSINCRSWLNLLVVVPRSTTEKNSNGALQVLSSLFR